MKSTVVDTAPAGQRDHGGIAFRELAVTGSPSGDAQVVGIRSGANLRALVM